jgi:hypothetical protein
MRRADHLSLVVVLACIGPAIAQTLPPLEEPTEPYVSFRVTAVTGALTALESVYTKPDRSGNSYFCYLPGDESPVVYASGDPLKFVVRMGGLKEPPTLEKWQALNKLERLSVGKKGRYATKKYVPMDVATYGPVSSTLDKKNNALYWFTLVYTPRESLPPGEYAFSSSGLSSPAGFEPRRAGAFRVR